MTQQPFWKPCPPPDNTPTVYKMPPPASSILHGNRCNGTLQNILPQEHIQLELSSLTPHQLHHQTRSPNTDKGAYPLTPLLCAGNPPGILERPGH
eukprot:14744304-Ditylum_brightwellii.AAC.1